MSSTQKICKQLKLAFVAAETERSTASSVAKDREREEIHQLRSNVAEKESEILALLEQIKLLSGVARDTQEAAASTATWEEVQRDVATVRNAAKTQSVLNPSERSFESVALATLQEAVRERDLRLALERERNTFLEQHNAHIKNLMVIKDNFLSSLQEFLGRRDSDFAQLSERALMEDKQRHDLIQVQLASAADTPGDRVAGESDRIPVTKSPLCISTRFQA